MSSLGIFIYELLRKSPLNESAPSSSSTVSSCAFATINLSAALTDHEPHSCLNLRERYSVTEVLQPNPSVVEVDPAKERNREVLLRRADNC